jgi:extracellular elastinolytic metalloproteinase
MFKLKTIGMMNYFLRPILFLLCFFVATHLIAQDAHLLLAQEKLDELGQKLHFAARDLEQPIITDYYTSQGITHIYYQQTIDEIGIYGSTAGVHIYENKVVNANLQFLKGLAKRNIEKELRIQALEAIARLALAQNYPLSQTELLILEADNEHPQKPTKISSAGISKRTIPMKLVFIEDEQNDLQLAWSVFIDEVNSADYKNFIVNAATGEIETVQNLTLSCEFDLHTEHKEEHSTHHRLEEVFNHHKKGRLLEECTEENALANSYNVFPIPIESPNFGNRSTVSSPWSKNTTASPNGWHQIGATNYTTTKGNNVDAYEDISNSNSPSAGDGSRVDGGPSLTFNHSINLNAPPITNKDAAITNLFYWNNVIHDVWYNYGFDENSGNFQEENFNRGGRGSDYVYAEAQDGKGTCNANMATPSDGSNPRMQMYVCGNRDGDFDNGVIVHEYGHGISNRLTGGPSSTICLFNQEQMGEGWSDWFALVMTIQSGDIATKNRTIGTWLFEQGPNDGGLRAYPYTTDMSKNPMTYNTIASTGTRAPHGVGAVWATMLWDLTWKMIDQYGWDADLYNGNGGNNRMMALVLEGLKLQPCSPGFVDGRNAILAADRLLYDGANQCLIWSAFARRGLGYSADQGDTRNKADGTEAFDMPPTCTVGLRKTANKKQAVVGEEIEYEILISNNLNIALNDLVLVDTLPSNLEFVSASNGATANGQLVTWPKRNLNGKQQLTETITARVKSDIQEIATEFEDDLENTSSNWTVSREGTNQDAMWNYQNTVAQSGNFAFHAPGTAPSGNANLTIASPLALTKNSELVFHHIYDIENRWDAGVVQISIDNGESWLDLGSKMTQNPYNNSTYYGFSGFTGKVANWLETKVDLSSYAGQTALIRFQMRFDYSNFEAGWYIDDISISHLGYSLINKVQVSNNDIAVTAVVDEATDIVLGECDNAVEVNLKNVVIPSADYRRSGDIEASGRVLRNSRVHFYAGNSIQLNAGFHVEAGAAFLARIEECKDGSSSLIGETEEEVALIDVAVNNLKLTKQLSNNHLTIRPNPFSHQAIIEYDLEEMSDVSIYLYDVTGKVLRRLHQSIEQRAGSYQFNFNRENLENGVYWISMKTKNDMLTKKLFILQN